MKKPVISKAKEKLIVDSEVLFRRLLVVSKQREVNLEDVLTHELSAISPLLFHDDGTMRKPPNQIYQRSLRHQYIASLAYSMQV